jgi:type I restriction enzyme M protein
MRGGTNPVEGQFVISAVLLLKWLNDEFDAARVRVEKTGSDPVDAASYAELGVRFVPPAARWERLTRVPEGESVQALRQALSELGLLDTMLDGLLGGLGHRSRGRADAGDRLVAVIRHFDGVRLRDDDLAGSTLVAAAFGHRLDQAADALGKSGGEFATPRAVARLLVELAQPKAGMRIYDPCVGGAGLLTSALEYLAERGGDPGELRLLGQDANAASAGAAAMALLFHRVPNAGIEVADALTEPRHLDDGADLVLTHPPFGLNYERLAFGRPTDWMPYWVGSVRSADLMFLQHMLSMVRNSKGSVFTLMPHGGLFRDGAEQAIRTALLDDDVVEAVIGLAPNLLHTTGIPVCALVLRAPGGKKPERRGKVLFINAEREYQTGRERNELLPGHLEKIVSAFHDYRDQPGFARIMTREELAENQDNLNIRRYVDSTPPTEPQDLRAHMEGGMPKAEVLARTDLLDSYRIGPLDLFAPRPGGPDGYYEFLPAGGRPDRARLVELAQAREQILWQAFDRAWSALCPLDRPAAELKSAFAAELATVGLLDGATLAGVFSAWWEAAWHDVLTLAEHGAAALVDGWVADVREILGNSGPSEARRPAYERPVVAALVPGFLDRLVAAEARRDALREQYEEAVQRVEANPDGPDRPEEEAGAAVSALKRELVLARQVVRAVDADFAISAPTTGERTREVALGILRDGLAGHLEAAVLRRRDELISCYLRWEEKYLLSFRQIESDLPGAPEASVTTGNNPWSAQRPLGTRRHGSPHEAEQNQVVHVLRNVIDTEKAIEAILEKAEIDRLATMTGALDQGAGLDRPSVPLRDLVLRSRVGAAGPWDTEPGGIPVLGPANMTGRGLDLSTVRYLRQDGRARTDRLRRGDVLVALHFPLTGDSTVRTDVWADQLPVASFQAHLLRLTVDTERLVPGYLVEWLRNPAAGGRVQALLSHTSGLRRIRVKDLLDVEVELPPLVEQRRLMAELAALDDRSQRRHAQLAKLRLIKETLTADLRTGRTSISYPE